MTKRPTGRRQRCSGRPNERDRIDSAAADAPVPYASGQTTGSEAASIRYLSGLQSLHGRSVPYHDAWTVDNPLAAAEIDRVIGQPGHRRRIDYVFVGSAHAHPRARARARIVRARLVADRPVDGVWLSDHAGVLADLDLEQTEIP